MKNIPFDCPLLLLLLLRFRKIPSVLEVKRRRSGVSSKALFQSSFYWLAAFFPHFLPACSLSCRSVVCHFAQRRYKPALLPFLPALRSSLSFALHFPLPVPEPSYPRVTHYRPHRITLNKKKRLRDHSVSSFCFPAATKAGRSLPGAGVINFFAPKGPAGKRTKRAAIRKPVPLR